MGLNLNTLFYEDFYGASWAITTNAIRTITWSNEDYALQLPSGNYETVTASLDAYIGDIRKAFEIWDEEIEGIDFVETNDGNSADVTIAATSIDGPGGAAGYWNYNWDGDKYILKATIRFDDVDLADGAVLTAAMREIGNILGLGDLRVSSDYMSVQEDPFPLDFSGNDLWDFDVEIINTLYPGSIYDVVVGTWRGSININPTINDAGGLFFQAQQVNRYDFDPQNPAGSLISGGSQDEILRGLAGWDIIDGGDGDDLVHGGNGRDIITGGYGSDELHGDFGWNTYKDQRDGYTDLIAIKSDQHLMNWWYGTSGNNANGEKADFIEGLDNYDQIKIIGVNSQDLSFKDGVTAKGVSGIGIYAKGALEAVYTGGNLSLGQISQITSGDDSAAAMANQMWSYWGDNTAPGLLA